jgi:hypothetical protein
MKPRQPVPQLPGFPLCPFTNASYSAANPDFQAIDEIQLNNNTIRHLPPCGRSGRFHPQACDA